MDCIYDQTLNQKHKIHPVLSGDPNSSIQANRKNLDINCNYQNYVQD